MQFRRLSFPGGIPGHTFWRSALHLPPATATLSCAVAFDDHNIKMEPIIRMIFIMGVRSLTWATKLPVRPGGFLDLSQICWPSLSLQDHPQRRLQERRLQ